MTNEAPAPEHIDALDVRFLDGAHTRIFVHGGVLRLTIEDQRSWIKVAAARAFPVTRPNEYIGFLDGRGKDVGMLVDPSTLDAESRSALDADLERRYFVPVVQRVLKSTQEFGTVYWTLETDRGTRDVVIRQLRDNLHELSPTRVIVSDIDGNRFEFPDIYKLDTLNLGLILRNL